MTGAMMRKTRQQDRREETRKQVLGSGTEALCLVGKVVYCSVVLRCINYRMRNDKLCRRAMYSHTERQTDRQIAVRASGCRLRVFTIKASIWEILCLCFKRL